MPVTISRPLCPRRPVLTLALCATGLGLMLAAGSAYSQDDDANWTGRLETDAIARKEAGAALAEGRRECARKREDRSACLKVVQQDYEAMMRRVASGDKSKR